MHMHICAHAQEHTRARTHTWHFLGFAGLLSPPQLKSMINFMIKFNSLVIFLINIKSKGIDSKPKVCSFFIFDLEIVDPVHFQVLGNLQVF